MKRRNVAALLLTALSATAVLTVRAADAPSAPAGQPSSAARDLAAKQQFLKQQWSEFSKNLLLVAQRLEKSDRNEDKDKAKALRKALELAEKEGVDNRFAVLLQTLSKSGEVPLTELNAAADQNKELATVIRQIIDILINNDDLARIREEQVRLQKILNELKAILKEQKINLALTESNRGDHKRLSTEQKNLALKTDNLAKKMGAKGEDKKDGNPKKGGEPKDGNGKKNDGKPNDGSKSGDPKNGSPKEGQPKNGNGQSKGGNPSQPKFTEPSKSPPQPQPPQPQQPPAPGAEQVKKAVPDQEKAGGELEENKRDNASQNQEQAIQKLLEAQKELEKRLKQLREEELERLLANLEARVARMLAMQREVYENTKSINNQVQKNPDKKPGKAEFQKSQQQSDREAEIVGEADRAIELLKSEGSAVAFPQVFEEVRKDMVRVKERLNKAVVDADTQMIEVDIIKALEEMVAALKKAQQDLKSGNGGGGGGPQDQKLLDEIAELKMIKALQVRVNERTLKYGQKYKGEQADDSFIKTELRDLGDRQERIETMVKDIVQGKNK